MGPLAGRGGLPGSMPARVAASYTETGRPDMVSVGGTAEVGVGGFDPLRILTGLPV